MADDIELGEKALDRKSSWRSKITSPTFPGVPFRRSSTLDSGTTSRSMTLEPQFHELPSLTFAEIQRQEALISLIVGDELIKGSLQTACSWYTRYLRCNFSNNWHLLAPSLVGLEDTSTKPRLGDLVVVYNFMIIVAQLFKSREDLALVDIVDELNNESLLKPQLDAERAVPNQIVFAALGWLSMLYEPVSHPQPDKLEVTKTSTNSLGKRHVLITRKYCTFRQGFDYIDSPLYSLIGRFGDLIPERQTYPIPMPGISGQLTREVILVQSVCLNTLQHIAGLRIEWVGSLALHLELDSGEKTLKIFQRPSFCRIMTVDKKRNLLSRLLNDHAARACEDVTFPEVPIDELFEELLLSYRLIFGQDERSWKSFSRLASTVGESQGQERNSWASDPLLRILCGKSYMSEEARVIYEEIDANQATTYYDPRSQFPFFGNRLVELQKFVNQHQPKNVKDLLNDRRDVAAWYTNRTNLLLALFATFTLLLMIVGLILQVWQGILAQEQLQQAIQQALPPSV